MGKKFISSLFFDLIVCCIVIEILIILNDCVISEPATFNFHTQVLICIAAAGPVIIGLFYSGLTFIANTTTSKIPLKVQDLLLNNRNSNILLHSLAITSFTSLIAIYLYTKEIALNYATPIATTAFIIELLGFIHLGKKLFSYLDPKIWQKEIIQQITKNIDIAIKDTKYGLFNNICLQYANRTIKFLDYYSILLQRTKSTAPSTDLIEMVNTFVNTLVSYENSKMKISPNSQWFITCEQHKPLYLSNESEIKITSITQTYKTDNVKDYFWFECKIEKLIISVIQEFLQRKNGYKVEEAIDIINTYNYLLIINGNFTDSIRFMQEIWKTIKPYLKTLNSKDILGILTHYFDCFINAALYLQEIRGYSAYDEKIKKIKKHKDIYKYSFPYFTLSSIEALFNQLEYEKLIEGKVVTPHRELKKELAPCFHNNLSNAIYYYFFGIFDFWDKIHTFVKQYPKFHALSFIKRKEYLSKWNYVLFTFFKKLDNENDLSYYIRTQNIDFNQLNKGFSIEENSARNNLIEILKSIDKIFDENFDLAGYIINIAKTTLIDSIKDYEKEEFADLFHFYAKACVQEFLHLSKTTQNNKCVIPLIDAIIATGWLTAICLNDEKKTVLKTRINEFVNHCLKITNNPNNLVVILMQAEKLNLNQFETESTWEKAILEYITKNNTQVTGILKELVENKNLNFTEGFDIFIAAYCYKNLDPTPFSFNFHHKHIYERYLKAKGF